MNAVFTLPLACRPEALAWLGKAEDKEFNAYREYLEVTAPKPNVV